MISDSDPAERSRTGRRRRGSAVLVLLLLVPTAAFAEYRTSFKKGYQALERKQYAEAIAHLREALQERSQEGGEDVKITGSFFAPYLPHYFLGVALAGAGDCTAAVSAWKESERQGFVVRTSRIRELRSYQDQCLGPALARAFEAGQAGIASAERAQKDLRALPSGQVDRQDWKVIADREAKAQDLLALARRKLDEGQRSRNPDVLAEARGLAANAEKELKSLQEEGSTLIAQWQQAQSRTAPAAPRIAQQSPTPTPRPDRQAEPSPTAQPSPTPAVLPDNPSRKPIPEPLLSGARAFLGADYQSAVRLLAKASFEDRRAAAQAALLRAAARMALYWRGADRDASLLAAARRDIREGRRMDPGLAVDTRVFSPRFRSFFDSAR